MALVLLAPLGLAAPAAAQNNAYTEPFEPFRVAGNMFRMEDKAKRMKAGEAKPFVDPRGYRAFVEAGEQSYQAQLKREQAK